MTELKTESQSTRITQSQPSAKRQLTKSIADPSGSESNAERAASTVESTTEATPTKKRRTTNTGKTSKTKSQATNKAPNQSASTRVKLTWEANPSIEAVLAQFNEQLNATWSAIDDLKATVEKMQAQDGTRSNNVRLPLESPLPVRPPQCPPHPPQSLPKPQTSIPPFRPMTSFPAARPRRRKPLHRIVQRLLKLPEQNSAIAIDAALWVLASAGLRIGLKYLVAAVPILNFPVILLMFVPALLAAYAALFIPQANRIGIYRLLLVTLGLFVGGKL